MAIPMSADLTPHVTGVYICIYILNFLSTDIRDLINLVSSESNIRQLVFLAITMLVYRRFLSGSLITFSTSFYFAFITIQIAFKCSIHN